MAWRRLADDYILASCDEFCRRLRSADVDTCTAPRIRTRFGDRSFSAAGPRIWNSLPPDLRIPSITEDISVCLGTAETAAN